MRVELEEADIQAIATAVLKMLKPSLAEMKVKEPDELMDVKSLAEYLEVKPSWIYKQVQYKSIPHFHAGKYPRFKRSEIDKWISDNTTPAITAPYPRLKLV